MKFKQTNAEKDYERIICQIIQYFEQAKWNAATKGKEEPPEL